MGNTTGRKRSVQKVVPLRATSPSVSLREDADGSAATSLRDGGGHNVLDRARLRREFKKQEPYYRKLAEEVEKMLLEATKQSEIRIHRIHSRVKTFDSFYEKAMTKQLAHPLEQITDLSGVRIVCLFLSQLKLIENQIRRLFEVESSDPKIDATAENDFGYLSNHYVVQLPRTFSGPHYEDICGRPCEIQVRTIAMDSWANVSHHLSYKQPSDVPTELRRDFFALSGLFYVADTHFEVFFHAAQQSRASVHQRARDDKNFRASDLNLDTLAAFLTQFYPNRVQGSEDDGNKALSDLLQELLRVEYRTIDKLQVALERGGDAFYALERRTFRDSARYTAVGAVRGTLQIVDPAFAAMREQRRRERL